MHAVTVLQKCLPDVFNQMHASRCRVLLGAVAALLMGRRLILMELARHFPGAERVRAPLKRMDRLLNNQHLAGEAERLYGGIARWLIRSLRPVIIIDWSDLKPDGSLHLLRAGIPVGGRTLTVLEEIHPERRKNSPRVEWAFLKRLKTLLPPEITPIIITDAGFRAPWFRAVTRLGWDYVGRVRHRIQVQLNDDGAWMTVVPCMLRRKVSRNASVPPTLCAICHGHVIWCWCKSPAGGAKRSHATANPPGRVKI